MIRNLRAIAEDQFDVQPANHGGTGQSVYAVGDILFASATTALSKRTIGASNDLLTVVG